MILNLIFFNYILFSKLYYLDFMYELRCLFLIKFMVKFKKIELYFKVFDIIFFLDLYEKYVFKFIKNCLKY